MSTIGYIILFLALEVSLFSAAASLLGRTMGYRRLAEGARIGVFAVCSLLSIAVILLLYALFSHDFHLSYVADYSSRATSPLYLLTSFYAGNEGSLLFWAWILSICAAFNVRRPFRNSAIMPFATAFVMASETFFLVLLVFLANPFAEASTLAADGRGLNPLLENIGMLLHPPTILAGYVAFTIPFALAIAALITGKPSDRWLSAVRRWVLLSWLLLGVGNIIGAWWAYTELDWGGYWAWDPVENAGLMPWMMATAVLHASVMQRTRGMFKTWHMILIILTFNLTIFGTFLARSDVLTSVHNFGLSEMDPFFLGFMGIALLGPLALVIYRRRELKGEAKEEKLISRENAFLLANLIIVFATLAVFLGTLLGWKQSFYNYWVGSSLVALIVVMGLCTLIGWQREKITRVGLRLIPGLFLALLTVLVLVVTGVSQWYGIALFALCAFVLGALLMAWYRGVRARMQARKVNPLKALFGLIWANKPRYGGLMVHLGILFICIGVVGSSFYSVEKTERLQPGDSIDIENYNLTYDDMSVNSTTSGTVISTTLLAYDGDKYLGVLTPEMQRRSGYNKWVTEVAIRYGLWDDLYVIMAWAEEDGTAIFQIMVNRLVTWIWIGSGVLFIGSLIALWPDRRRPALRDYEAEMREESSSP
jgi:cytochrome c-type biogenesis protein CcmF